MKTNWHISIRILAVLLLLGFSACAKQTFDKQQNTVTVQANQFVTIKPKADIILFQDISASMLVPLNTLKAQLNSFVQSIDSSWDFHFAVLPLQNQDDLRFRYIIAQDCSSVLNGFCLTPAQSSFFDSFGGWYSANVNNGSTDLGFQNMQSNLSNTNSMVLSGFKRSDALQFVISFTNGNDVTGMTYPQDWMDRGDGQLVPNYNSPNAIASFNNFQSFLTNTYVTNVSQINYFSVAAAVDYSNCYGVGAWAGTRYNNMATAIDIAYPGYVNGASYDLCTGQLNSVLANIAARMQTIITAIQFDYVVLPERPVPSTLQIKKNGSVIPANDPVNGWTLFNVVGGVQQFTTNKATSFAPFVGNFQSGFFIQLNGNARFQGSDSISITYEKF